MSTHEVDMSTGQGVRPEPVLRWLGGLLFAGGIVYLAGSWVLPAYVRERPFLPHSVVKVVVLGLCCLHGSGWLARHGPLVGAACLAHVLSIGVLLLDLFALPASGALGADGSGWAVRDVLVGAVALDGVIALLLAWAWWRSKKTPYEGPPPGATPADRTLRRLLLGLGLAYGAATVAFAALPFVGAASAVAVELPFVSNTAVRTGIFALLCFVARRDLARHVAALDILVVGQLVAVFAGLALLPGAEGSTWFSAAGVEWSMRGVLTAVVVLDLAVGLALTLVAVKACRDREGLAFLRPVEFRALAALAESLVDVRSEGTPSAKDVARHTDQHLAPIRAARIWLFRAALFGTQLLPVLRLRPPMSEMEPGLRLRDLKRRFGYEPLSEIGKDRTRQILQALIRIAKQLVYVGYYNDSRVHQKIGYVPFSKRPARPFEDPPGRTVSDTTLEVTRGVDVGAAVAEVCIIGSGAAGSTLAHQLVQQGKHVLLVERGQYAEPRTFTEDELEMIGRLYADGITQQTADFRFTILQGSCVGGGTTVNNGVVFDLPAYKLKEWNEQYGAGLDAGAIAESTRAMRELLRVQRQTPYNEPGADPENAAFLNPSSYPFLQALRTHAPDLYPDTGVVEANIENSLGSGYENIGDRYGRKLGTLETLLPDAQKTGRLEIVSGLEVDRLRTGRGRRVAWAEGSDARGRRVRILARTFVVASGAVASSWLLLRNGIRVGGRVGTGFSANLGSYLTVDTGRETHSERGLQISHYALPRPWPDAAPPYVLETWWNPPATQSTNMPGWFEDHTRNMEAYGRLMGVGVLVGTASSGVIRPALTGGAEVLYTPSDGELARLAAGLRSVAEITLKDGATRVMPNVWDYDEYTDVSQLDGLVEKVRRGRYLTVGTGHPQGGNAMCTDPERGVVGPDFRVHGMDNLYVCDASVFPTSVGLNPQMTVFALAHHAAQRIAEATA